MRLARRASAGSRFQDVRLASTRGLAVRGCPRAWVRLPGLPGAALAGLRQQACGLRCSLRRGSVGSTVGAT